MTIEKNALKDSPRINGNNTKSKSACQKLVLARIFVNKKKGGRFYGKTTGFCDRTGFITVRNILEKAIESVLAQNVPIELLVIVDCSTDKTELTV